MNHVIIYLVLGWLSTQTSLSRYFLHSCEEYFFLRCAIKVVMEEAVGMLGFSSMVKPGYMHALKLTPCRNIH